MLWLNKFSVFFDCSAVCSEGNMSGGVFLVEGGGGGAVLLVFFFSPCITWIYEISFVLPSACDIGCYT